jgi:hypothetical protein
MNDKGVHMTDEDKEQMDQKSLMQKHKNMIRRATMQTSVPVGTAMTMSHQQDQIQVY